MKFFLTIIFILFYVNYVSATGIREMSKEDQHILLMNAINWDRKLVGDMLDIKMETMEYDGLKEEYIIWTEECQKVSTEMSNTSMILSGDENGRKFLEAYQTSAALFFPSFTTIGCSKDFICTYTIPKDLDDEELAGKTVELYGVCVLENYYTISDEDYLKLYNAWLTKPWKYGDIIGVLGPVKNSANHVTSTERYLSVDAQNKLINAINEDIKEVARKTNLTIKPLKYSPYLERAILWNEEDCFDSVAYANGPKLSGDSDARKILDTYHATSEFFDPSYETIGCSPNFKCKHEYDDKKVREINISKNVVEFRGICIFGEKHTSYLQSISGKITLPELPKLSKYWDIIAADEKDSNGKTGASGGEGNQNSGGADPNSGKTGSVINLLFSLFLVFYI